MHPLDGFSVTIFLLIKKKEKRKKKLKDNTGEDRV